MRAHTHALRARIRTTVAASHIHILAFCVSSTPAFLRSDFASQGSSAASTGHPLISRIRTRVGSISNGVSGRVRQLHSWACVLLGGRIMAELSQARDAGMAGVGGLTVLPGNEINLRCHHVEPLEFTAPELRLVQPRLAELLTRLSPAADAQSHFGPGSLHPEALRMRVPVVHPVWLRTSLVICPRRLRKSPQTLRRWLRRPPGAFVHRARSRSPSCGQSWSSSERCCRSTTAASSGRSRTPGARGWVEADNVGVEAMLVERSLASES